jgi:hypothetical protein
MPWAQLASSVLAEVNLLPLFFIALLLLLVAWGAISSLSIKAAAKKPTGVRITPPPLPPARRNVGMPPPLPRLTPRGPATGVSGALPPLPRLAQGAPAQRVAKTRGMRSGNPPAPVVPTARRGAQVASIVSAIASPAREAVSTPAQLRSAVSSWVNVKTLRSEFLLAEALRPPVALRDDPFAST